MPGGGEGEGAGVKSLWGHHCQGLLQAAEHGFQQEAALESQDKNSGQNLGANSTRSGPPVPISSWTQCPGLLALGEHEVCSAVLGI